ncbi:MAG: hypothetical protein GHCLOJNM_03249 [bacterium]|nr:hypothetical protein [bacterium]
MKVYTLFQAVGHPFESGLSYQEISCLAILRSFVRPM